MKFLDCERLREQLQEGEDSFVERLARISEEGIVPDSVFHLFACACAERALDVEEQVGHLSSPSSRKAIESKRAWLRGDLSLQALQQAAVEARSAAHVASVKNVGYEAASAAADAGSPIEYAVRATAWSHAAIQKSMHLLEAQEHIDESAWQLEAFLQLVQELSSPSFS